MLSGYQPGARSPCLHPGQDRRKPTFEGKSAPLSPIRKGAALLNPRAFTHFTLPAKENLLSLFPRKEMQLSALVVQVRIAKLIVLNLSFIVSIGRTNALAHIAPLFLFHAEYCPFP
jgi:hypothetical protein